MYTEKETQQVVEKRDGRQVDFDPGKIRKAILAAMNAQETDAENQIDVF
ncbi:ATP cone domain [Listeria grayi]|nr:ATP cone domain [Listeria grayi]